MNAHLSRLRERTSAFRAHGVLYNDFDREQVGDHVAAVVPVMLVWLNGPVTETFVMLSTPAPVFVSVTVIALLVVKTTWVANVRLVGESVTAGSTPAPESGTL